jgi:hypothetical protein
MMSRICNQLGYSPASAKLAGELIYECFRIPETISSERDEYDGASVVSDFRVGGKHQRGLTIATAGHQTPEDNATRLQLAPPTLAGDEQLQKFQKMPAFERRDPALTLSPE